MMRRFAPARPKPGAEYPGVAGACFARSRPAARAAGWPRSASVEHGIGMVFRTAAAAGLAAQPASVVGDYAPRCSSPVRGSGAQSGE